MTNAPKRLRWTPHSVWKVPTREHWLGLVREHGPELAGEKLREIWLKREEQIRLEIENPLRYSYEPEIFKKARELLTLYDELYLLGGNREGKTFFAVKYVVEQLVNKPNQQWAFFHSSEQSSIRQQQNKIHTMLPPEWREIGRLGAETYVKWTRQNGFSGGQFILPNKSAGMFFNYKQNPDVTEGYELDGAWFDELVPLEFIETMAFRLGQGRKLKLLVTFTPKNGYNPTVARALVGARVLETRLAPLLSPTVKHARDCPPGHMPYVMSKTKSATLFFHLHMNPFGAGVEVTRELKDKPVNVVKERAYGWADKLMVSAFPKYSAVHRIPREEFNKIAARGGTRYCVADPGDTKNWFIKWYFCTPQKWTIVYREWPPMQTHGEWALHPDKPEKLDWRPGEAQRLEAGRGMAAYRQLILELEGGRWQHKERKWDMTKAEKIQLRQIDCRMGGRGTPGQEEGTSIIDLMAEATPDKTNNIPVPAMHWEEAPDSHIAESLQLLQDAMDYDSEQPVNVLNQPRWFVVDDLLQTDLAYKEYTGAGSQKDALKDIVDPDRYFIKSGYGFVSPEMLRVRGGMHY